LDSCLGLSNGHSSLVENTLGARCEPICVHFVFGRGTCVKWPFETNFYCTLRVCPLRGLKKNRFVFSFVFCFLRSSL
jgi:hypothetical protein